MRTCSPSVTAGKAAMCLPNRPRLATNRPTSAALSVLYFRVTPDSGSYVFSSRYAFGAFDTVLSPSAAPAPSPAVLDSVVPLRSRAAALRARFFAVRALSGFGTVYLVVILVWTPCQSAGTMCGEVGRTVVGRASSSSDDCRSHSSLVGNSGML